MAEVRLEAIKKQIGRTEVIPDLTLTVHDGELFTLVGPSGCGKSTLLHLIAGLEAPTGGRILFDGDDVTALEPRARDVALVFQNYALYPHMSVAENLAFPLRVGSRGRPLDRAGIEREVRRVAGLLGLESLLMRRPKDLSGGQRQRVALGRAIIRRPRVFLLDEPLSNLDAQLRAGMRAELRRLHDELAVTMIYVTHDQTEATSLSDRVGVLDHGRLQQVGTPLDVYERPRNRFVAGFMGYPPMNLLEARMEETVAMAGPLRVPLRLRSEAFPKRRVTLGLRPEEVQVRSLQAISKGGSREHQMIGTIRLIEPVSGQSWVTCEIDTSTGDMKSVMTMVGSAERLFKGRPGDRVLLSWSDATLHLFDSETGRRLDEHA